MSLGFVGVLLATGVAEPFKPTFTGFSSGSLDGIEKLALKVPDVVGANLIVIEQD